MALCTSLQPHATSGSLRQLRKVQSQPQLMHLHCTHLFSYAAVAGVAQTLAWQSCSCSSTHSNRQYSTEDWQHEQSQHTRTPEHRSRPRKALTAAGSSDMQPLAGSEALQQQPQQQQPEGRQHQMPGSLNGAGVLGRQYAQVVMPPLEQQQQPRVPAFLAWIPPPLLLHIQSLLGFLRACWELLPEFKSPSLPEALRRLALVLGASLVMIVVVSTIDSGWLYLYLLNARKVAVAV